MASPLTRIIRKQFPGAYLTAEAATTIGRSESTLVRWRKLGVLTPSLWYEAGNVRVWLYSDDDIQQGKALARTARIRTIRRTSNGEMGEKAVQDHV
jgi:hypothetical protein